MLSAEEISKGISVIICTYNGEGRIVKTLSHLACQKVGKHISWEVIVVDNNSTDDTAKVVIDNCQPPMTLKLVRENKRGQTHARSRGIAAASYEYISFIDDDNRVAENWVSEVYRVFEENREIGMCGGRNEPVFEVPPPAWFESVKGCYAVGAQGEETADITETRGFLWGAGMCFRKSYYLNLVSAGFDYHTAGRIGTRLGAGDDSELCMAFIAAGYRLWYVETLRLQHYMPESRITWEYAKGLFSGLGESELLLDVYKNTIQQKKIPLIRIYLSLIPYSILYFGWRLAFLMKNQDSNTRYLSYIARKRYIFAAMQQLFSIHKTHSRIKHFYYEVKKQSQNTF
jgi:glycosyltransferase involved in cell wall biosynthesis